MKTRVITALILTALFIPVLIFSKTIVYPIVISLLCVIAVYEMLKCLKVMDKYYFSIPFLVFAVAAPIIARYKSEYVFLLVFLVFIYIFISIVVYNGKIPFTEIILTFFEMVLIIFGFTSLVLVRDIIPNFYYIIFLAAWGTDISAIFAGKYFGKRKLCPDISPKKTVAGSVGGIIGAVVCFSAFILVLNLLNIQVAKPAVIIFLAIPLSIIGQIGDLAASVIKRKYNIKDYGNIFPGHGGVLDRFDSILPIAIVTYFVCAGFNIL